MSEEHNESLQEIVGALNDLAATASNMVSELTAIGDIASQLNLIKGELWEIAGNTKTIANSQRELVNLLENMTFSCRSTSYPHARYLRVWSDSE